GVDIIAPTTVATMTAAILTAAMRISLPRSDGETSQKNTDDRLGTAAPVVTHSMEWQVARVYRNLRGPPLRCGVNGLPHLLAASASPRLPSETRHARAGPGLPQGSLEDHPTASVELHA